MDRGEKDRYEVANSVLDIDGRTTVTFTSQGNFSTRYPLP